MVVVICWVEEGDDVGVVDVEVCVLYVVVDELWGCWFDEEVVEVGGD